MMKILNIALVGSFLLLAGCATSSNSVPFLGAQSYTTLSQEGLPLLSVKGAGEGWIIYSSSLELGFINAHRHAFDGDGNQYGSVSLHVRIAGTEDPNQSQVFFSYDFLLNKNYVQRAEYIKSTRFNEKTRREVGYREIIVEPVQFRNLQCMEQLTARGATSRMGGYGLQKNLGCPIVINNHLGNLGFTITINHWRATLEDLQAYYGEDYLRIVFRDLEEMLKPTLESLEFHVDFSQNPDDLKGYNFPPLPEDMTYTDFYLGVIPEQFHLLSPPYVLPWNRVLTQEDVVKMKSKGLTVPMARQWKAFFERAREAKETQLRESPTRKITEEGIQIELQREVDMVRLFAEVIEMWDEVSHSPSEEF